MSCAGSALGWLWLVAWAGSYSSDSTPGLGTCMCRRCSPKKTKTKKKPTLLNDFHRRVKVSKLSSFYFPLKLSTQNSSSAWKGTLLQASTFMPPNYFLHFNHASGNHRAQPGPSCMLKVHCLERQFCNQPKRRHYAVIIWLGILSFTYLTEGEDAAETKKENILMLFSPKFAPGYSFAIPA